MKTQHPHDNPQTEQSALHQEHTVNNINAPINVHFHNHNYFYGTPPPDGHWQQHEQQHHAHEQQPYDAQAQAHYEQARHDHDVPLYPLRFPARYQDAYDVEDVDYVEVESVPAAEAKQAQPEPEVEAKAAPQAESRQESPQPGAYPPPGQGTGQFPYITPTPHKTAEQIRQELWQACEDARSGGAHLLAQHLMRATQRNELTLRGVPATKILHLLQNFYGQLPFKYKNFSKYYRR